MMCLPAARICLLISKCKWFGVQLWTTSISLSARKSLTVPKALGMFSFEALALASSSPASQRPTISTNPSRLAASTWAGPMNPVPIIPALTVFIDLLEAARLHFRQKARRRVPRLLHRGHLDPGFRFLGGHHGLKHRDTARAIEKIRVNFGIGRNR